MVLGVVLDPAMARAIVRKAGLRAGAGIHDSLDWIYALFFEDLPYNKPDFNIYGVIKRHIRKRSAEDFDVMYGADMSSYGGSGLASYDIFEYQPTAWNHSEAYAPGVNFDFAADNRLHWTHPFITGRTEYDPFPYPELPCYFQADLSHFNIMTIHHGNRRYQHASSFANARQAVQMGVTGTISGTETPNLLDDAHPVWLKLWASLDGGSTWQNPLFLDQQNNGGWVHLHTKAGGGTIGSNVAFILPEFRREGVLMKLTLTAPSTDVIIYLTHISVRAFGPVGNLFGFAVY